MWYCVGDAARHSAFNLAIIVSQHLGPTLIWSSWRIGIGFSGPPMAWKGACEWITMKNLGLTRQSAFVVSPAAGFNSSMRHCRSHKTTAARSDGGGCTIRGMACTSCSRPQSSSWTRPGHVLTDFPPNSISGRSSVDPGFSKVSDGNDRLLAGRQARCQCHRSAVRTGPDSTGDDYDRVGSRPTRRRGAIDPGKLLIPRPGSETDCDE